MSKVMDYPLADALNECRGSLSLSVRRLVEEIDRRPENYPYSEVDMDMHVEAVTKDLRAVNAQMLAALKMLVNSVGSRPVTSVDEGERIALQVISKAESRS